MPRTRGGMMAGVGSVGSGILAAGVCTYLFLSVTARALGPEKFAPISTLWSAVFIIGPGLFLPMQQELGRILASRRTDRAGGDPVRKALLTAAGMSAIAIAATLAASFWLTAHLFAGDWTLLWSFEAAIVGYALVFVARGVLSGLGDFGRFGRIVVAEAFLRMIAAIVLRVLGVHTAGWYAVVIGAAPYLAALIVTRAGTRLRLAAGEPTTWREVSRALGWLLVGSLLAQGLANIGPIAVQALAHGDQTAAAGRFLSALVIARVSLYLFQAVQATLLPNLSELAAAGKLDDLRHAVGKLSKVAGALVVISTAGALAFGPFVVRILFGDAFAIGHVTMAMLAGASAVYVLAAALNGATIAVGGHYLSALGWGIGCTGLGVGLLFSHDLLLRVQIGYLLGSVAAAATFLVGMPALLRRHEMTADGSLTGLNEPPLEV